MSVEQGRIDVHHHLIPPAFVEMMRRKGIEQVAGAPLPGWTPEKSIRVMDANGIQTAITSLSAPGVHFGDGVQQAATLARRCNEYSAEIIQRFPGRFGTFAVLPTPFTDAACTEAIQALEVFQADGVVLLGSTDGVFLGDPRFEELMAELDRRQALVFVHPNLHASSDQLGFRTPGFLMEFLCDTTRAALNLMVSGTLDRYPSIRWILAHAGGFLPFIAARLTQADELPEFKDRAPRDLLDYVRSFYFDTALSPSRYSMQVLRQLVDPSHILFGSDFPFGPAPITALQCRTLDASPIWANAQQYAINRGNALQLLPRYQRAGEQDIAHPLFAGETLPQRLRRAMTVPMAGIAERLRAR